jgi:hypothetical protein
MVVATESRSRQENRERALKRIREAIALRIREPIDRESLPELLRKSALQGLRLSKKSPEFPMLAALVLDLVDADAGKVSESADRLELATSVIVRFLKTTPELWEATQQLRDKHGLAHLR